MAHLWKVSERSRSPERDPTITDHLILADKYLSEAHRLDPSDARIPGFEGSVKMALGSIHQDEALKRRGYFMTLTATSRPSRVSRARYTSPIPPAPIGARIS